MEGKVRTGIYLAGLALAGVVSAAPIAAETLAERGAYLVRGIMGCGNCHTPMDPQGFVEGQELAGRLVEDIEPFTAYAPNITPASRVASWSDAELGRAIREGIRPDGSVIGMPMPFAVYRGIGDDDLAAIVAFLRTLPSVEHDVPESEYRIPLPPAWGPPLETVAAPPRDVSVEYGAYLAGPIAHCTECHSLIGPQGPMLDTHLGTGGYAFRGPWGVSVAPNITSHEDGLAAYTDDEIRAMITDGVHPTGRPMLPPMPYGFLARMTPEDLDAIVLYLRSLPPLPDPA
jgi:mono/diheme cytochrome c family protein